MPKCLCCGGELTKEEVEIHEKLKQEELKLADLFEKHKLSFPIWQDKENPNLLMVSIKDKYEKKFGVDKLQKLIDMRIQYDKRLVKNIQNKKIELLWIWESEFKNQEELAKKIEGFRNYYTPKYIG